MSVRLCPIADFLISIATNIRRASMRTIIIIKKNPLTSGQMGESQYQLAKEVYGNTTGGVKGSLNASGNGRNADSIFIGDRVFGNAVFDYYESRNLAQVKYPALRTAFRLRGYSDWSSDGGFGFDISNPTLRSTQVFFQAISSKNSTRQEAMDEISSAIKSVFGRSIGAIQIAIADDSKQSTMPVTASQQAEAVKKAGSVRATIPATQTKINAQVQKEYLDAQKNQPGYFENILPSLPKGGFLDSVGLGLGVSAPIALLIAAGFAVAILRR